MQENNSNNTIVMFKGLKMYWGAAYANNVIQMH